MRFAALDKQRIELNLNVSKCVFVIGTFVPIIIVIFNFILKLYFLRTLNDFELNYVLIIIIDYYDLINETKGHFD